MITNKWQKAIEHIDFALQPIVDINTGVVFAYESLLREYEKAGFESIDDFFNKAYEEKVLFSVDLELRKKILDKIKDLYIKNKEFFLFYNLDNRIIEMDNYKTGLTMDMLDKYSYPNNFITFEVSEKHEFESYIKAKTILNLYTEQGFNVALDDFGTGYSGLKMLYHLNPTFIKIDRFFISDIINDYKKRLYVTNIVNIAHQSNAKVIAEGVETIEEFNICKEIGCDFVQGFYIQKPTTNIDKLRTNYFKKKRLNEDKHFINNFNLDNIYFTSNIYNDLIDKNIIATSWNMKGIVTSVSEAFCKISGYEKSELIGKRHHISKNMKKNTLKKIINKLKESRSWQGEIITYKKDKSIYHIDTKISPNYNHENKVIGFTSIMTDITDKKNLEKFMNK